MFPVELKVVAFTYEFQKFDQSVQVGPWPFFPPKPPNIPACHFDEHIDIEGSDIHGNNKGVGDLVSSGNLLCSLIGRQILNMRLHPQTLISFPLGGH